MMPETLTEALQAIADRVDAADIAIGGRVVRATIDPTRLEPPCVLVAPAPTPAALRYNLLAGPDAGYTLTGRVTVLVRDKGVTRALDDLGVIVPQVAAVLPAEAWAFAQTSAPNYSSQGLPSAVADIPIHVTN